MKKNTILEWLIVGIGFLGFLIIFGTVGLSDYETEAFLSGSLTTITPFSVIVGRSLFGLALIGGSILAHRKFIK